MSEVGAGDWALEGANETEVRNSSGGLHLIAIHGTQFYLWARDWQTFPLKSQIVNILVFAGYRVPLSAGSDLLL